MIRTDFVIEVRVDSDAPFRTTLRDFLDANAETLEPAVVGALRALTPAASLAGGGGAGFEWVVTRLAVPVECASSEHYVVSGSGRIECVSAIDAHRTALALPKAARFRGELMLAQYVAGEQVWPKALDDARAFVPAFAFQTFGGVA